MAGKQLGGPSTAGFGSQQRCPASTNQQHPASSWDSKKGTEAGETFAFEQCHSLLTKPLRERLLKLFAQLTGLELHVFWHNPAAPQTLVCPAARSAADAKGEQPVICRMCMQERWRFAALPGGPAQRFVGLCGMVNLCANVQVGNIRPLTLALQARITDHPGFQHLDPSHWARAVTSEGFNKAETLLGQLVLHDLEATICAHRVGVRLQEACRRLQNMSGSGGKPAPDREELFAAGSYSLSGSHTEQIVHFMIDYIHEHYHRPMGLGDVAAELKMNASYLCNLFSRTAGVTFHKYLDGLRLAKAKELLGDPRTRVREVALAVGYVSANHFRNVFKAREGVSPSAWRQTWRPAEDQPSL